MEPPSQGVPNATLAGKETSGWGVLSSRWFDADQTWLIGIVLAITGNFLISIALNVQKYSHLLLACVANQKPCYRSKAWWCGIILMGIGEMGNFAAYGFASIMLIAPLGSVVLIGGTLTIAGIFLLVTFAPYVTRELTAKQIQSYLVSCPFLIYVIMEIIAFCILLYFYKRRGVQHIALLLTMVALLASLTVIGVKAVATMLILSVKGTMQLTYPIFYLMLIIMVLTCGFQVKFLDQASKLYGASEVIPLNYVCFTLSAVIAGAVFYQEFQGSGVLSGFMFVFGCFLSFVGVFVLTQNRVKENLTSLYIDYGHVPGEKMKDKVQPDSLAYGSLCIEGDSVKTQS